MSLLNKVNITGAVLNSCVGIYNSVSGHAGFACLSFAAATYLLCCVEWK